MAKGIRVNQLAKELGVTSKAILEKCRDEGLGEKVPNHMSVLSIGLAETVREWFQGGGGTAVETAAPVDEALVVKARRKKKDDEAAAKAEKEAQRKRKLEAQEARKRAAAAEAAHQSDGDGAVAVAEVEAPEAPEAPTAAEPSAPEAEVAVEEQAHPVAPQPPPAVEPEPAQAEPVAEAPAPAPPQRPAQRPTVTLADRNRSSRERQAPVTPAPKLVVPEPAKIQGPRVVREEAPEVVPTPRPRRPAASGDGPAFTPTRPQGGRGVRVSEEEEEAAKKKAAGKKGGSLSSRRRGPDGRRGEADEKLREFTEADLLERRERLAGASSYRTGFDSHLKKSSGRGRGIQARTAVQSGEPVEIEEPITVKSLSSALGVKSNDIMSKLIRQGIFANVNQSLSREVAELVALEYGVELQVQEEATLEEQFMQELENRPSAEENLRPRPPVVTILGHVDHGKTSLLDKIRSANVAAGEAGGITQHTAAWKVTLGEGDDAKRVTFIDTPGHQAFTSMRARGAQVTDVVVLVVSAAEGVQPQTVESINHARAAKVPIVVAMNKIDRPDVNEQKVLGELAGQGLNPVEWGGDIEVVRTSAITGQGISELIEILHYQAELLELKADPTAPARGTVIEARLDEGLGAVATVLIQEGTLKVGDVVLCGPGFGRVRSLLDDYRKPITEAGPATPVIISGLSEPPQAGDKLYVVSDMEQARNIAEERANRSRQQQLAQRNQVTAANLLDTIKEGQIKTINLIIKADVQGSVETLVKTVTDYNTDEVKTRVIHAAVGAINESDVELAAATKDVNESTVIIGFHVVPDEAARSLAEQLHVEIRTYRVIYEIFDDLKKALSGLLEPEVREKLHGHVEVRQVFKVSKLGNIAGCYVTDGHVQRGSRIRLIRDGRVVTEDLTIDSLKRLKDDVREVKAGLECGIKLAGYDDIKVGDVFEAYIRETHQRTL